MDMVCNLPDIVTSVPFAANFEYDGQFRDGTVLSSGIPSVGYNLDAAGFVFDKETPTATPIIKLRIIKPPVKIKIDLKPMVREVTR